MPTEIRVVDDVAEAFATLASEAAPARFALSGGSLAGECYRQLAGRGADWSRTSFLLSDERWVPVEHPASNEGEARRAWLDATDTGPIHSLVRAGETPDAAAEAYEALIERLGPADLLHLGLGEDGHTASLFPGSPALSERQRLVVATGDAAHDWPRLTFTYKAISACETVVVTVSGEGKREAFTRVRRGDVSAPAARIEAPRVIWLADPAAAGDERVDRSTP